ncbi:MAG TPA: YiiD C-terminal domain-containing protein [Rhodocyclaceae bacterium]|nr:YiiD C-terminal domain-containing protein [Rhodocyclaceae bacterium]
MSPTTLTLQQYLHEHIPLSKAMQVSVVSVSRESVVLSAPLEPNINHRETVFGGSASALAILSAWSLLHTRLQVEHPASCRLVIQRNTMEYSLPIQGQFLARSALVLPEQWPSFLRVLSRRGKGRIAVKSVLEHLGQPVGEFSGEFVALGSDAAA